jgi:hypothetical protein
MLARVRWVLPFAAAFMASWTVWFDMRTAFAAERAEIKISYEAPKAESYRWIHDLLKRERVLQTVRQAISVIRLPARLTYRIKECGDDDGASYFNRTVTVCYEFIEAMGRDPSLGSGPGRPRGEVILGPLVHTLFHETGHALFELGGRRTQQTSSQPIACCISKSHIYGI